MSGWMKLRVFAAITMIAFGLTACGDDEPEKEEIAACTENDDCSAGFDCVDGTCEPQLPCSETQLCERGLCIDGGCTNPETCTGSEACLAGYACDRGTCVVDNCDGVTCDRGVCSPDSGECVNADVCTRATQDVDCTEGFFCYGQTCEDPTTICNDVDCELGVCDPATQQCVNPDMCTVDTDCLAGSFCENGTCSDNICDANMIDCPRGVCDSVSGECVNPDACVDGTECINGFYCIEGACTPTEDACAVCEGNRLCDYDGTNAVSCQENPAGCRNAVDCDGTRVCRDAACVAAPTCEADALEPNDDSASATTLSFETGQNFAEASLCNGDVDQFAFDTTESELFTGTLVVAVSFDLEDVGNGELNLELIAPDGTSVGSTMSANGSAVITHQVGATTRGVYRAVVTDQAGNSVAGIRYGLYASFTDGSIVTACDSAPERMGTITGDTTSGGSVALDSSCAVDGAGTPEDIYVVEVERRQLLTARATPTGGAFDISVGLRTLCFIDQTELGCSSEVGGNPAELNTLVEPGTYYVVVQGAQPGTRGAYQLDITLNDVVCPPGESRCTGTGAAEVCRSNGTGYDLVNCDQGCSTETQFCNVTEGDVCMAPIDASNGGVFTGVAADYGSDYDPGFGSCAEYGAEGEDVVFSVQANAGDTINAVFDASYDSVIYIVRSCGDVAASCVAGVDIEITEAEELSYTVPSDGTYLIIGDAYSLGETGSWTMTIDVSPQICTPGTTQCNGAALEICNTNGTAYDARNCSAGCANGVCNVPTNSVCGGAVDVTAGGQFTGFIEDFSADYDPTAAGCTQTDSPAADATFVVNATAGDVIDASLTASFSGVIYAATDCSDLAGTCSGASAAFTPSFRTVAQTTGPVYIIVDSDDASPTGEFTLDVTVQPRVCTPGTPTCASDGVTLEFCDQFGLSTSSYTCSTTCLTGATECTNPTGGICYDAVTIADGATQAGAFNNTNDFNPGVGTFGNCTFGSADEAVGSDQFFDLTIPAGQSLLVEFNSNSSYGMAYLLGDCSDANSCLASIPSGTGGELFYTNTSGLDEDVTLVIDRALTGSSTLTFDFTVDIFVPDCAALNTNLGCIDGSTLQQCDAYGRFVNESCNFGCDFGLNDCAAPPNDTCASPGIDASFGGSFTANIEDYAADFDTTSAGCTGRGAAGQDAVYTIAGTPGDIVRATLNSSFNGSLYAVTDCADVVNSCLDGSDTFSQPEELVVAIPASGSLYLMVDTILNTTGSFTLDIVVEPPTCVANSVSCQNGDVATCDAIGSEVSLRPCVAGCDPSTNACFPVPNDTCGMTGIDATAGGQFVGLIDDFTNDYDPTSSGCTGFAAAGGDAVYTVNAAPGDIISAAMDADFDSAVYIVTDCSMIQASCVDGDDSGGIEEVKYAAPTAGTYYIIADGFSSTASGLYQLDVSVTQPICTAMTNSCGAVSGDLEQCNDFGDDFTVKYCQAGCDPATTACAPPTNDTCVAPTDATNGGTFRGAIQDYASDYDPTSSGCTGRSLTGGDAVYAIQASPGDVITAFLDADFDASMYIVTDCTMLGTCEATARGSDSSLGFNVTTAGLYYLVVDSPSGASGNFEVNIASGLPVCNPGEAFCNADGVTLEYCNSFGTGFRPYSCDGTCTNVACDNPTAELCVDAQPLTSGSSVTETFEGSNTFEIPVGTSGACTVASGDVSAGTDWFYSVDLNAGETLTANFTSSSSFAVMYLMGSCSQANTCLATSSIGSSGTVNYTATVAERVFIVMDRTLSGSTSFYDFTLDVTVQ